MDPISQAVTGAALAGCFSKKKTLKPALIIGALSGMAPDLDILIRSNADPMMALEYHRHFTHSIFFSPLGGAICALFFWLLPVTRRNISFKQCYIFSFLGLFTHGFLDSCTGFGTHLLWPFTNMRESWNIIGIIDPLYTLPALILLIIAFLKRSNTVSLAALILMLAYISLGYYQNKRATEITTKWLEQQNIKYKQLTLRPTIGNLWLWRILYHDKTTNHWQTHALYIPYWNDKTSIKLGESVPILEKDIFHKYPANTVAGVDLRKFQFFSDNYLSSSYTNDGRLAIGDIRYSATPDSAQPLWGIELPGDTNNHITRYRNPRKTIDWDYVEELLKGEGFTPIN